MIQAPNALRTHERELEVAKRSRPIRIGGYTISRASGSNSTRFGRFAAPSSATLPKAALGAKLESPEGIAYCEEILKTPGPGVAELGPGDLSLALGYREMPRDNYPPEMREARERVFRANGVAFLETATPANITSKLDEGVRVIAGHSEEAARRGRAHQNRKMPV